MKTIFSILIALLLFVVIDSKQANAEKKEAVFDYSINQFSMTSIVVEKNVFIIIQSAMIVPKKTKKAYIDYDMYCKNQLAFKDPDYFLKYGLINRHNYKTNNYNNLIPNSPKYKIAYGLRHG